MSRDDEARSILAQCEFVYDLMSDMRRRGDGQRLEEMPEADWRAFQTTWDLAWSRANISTKRRELIDRVERGITRVYHGKPYAITPDPAVQGEMFVAPNESEATS